MQYHIENKIYRPRLSVWRVILGAFWTGLALLVIYYGFIQTDEVEIIPSIIVALFLSLVAFAFNYSLYYSYFSHNTPNGISGLGTSFSTDEINREISALDFQEIVENTGIYSAGNWLALQVPKDEFFILLPVGMVRFFTYAKVLRNDGVDASGESYNDYTFSFYLTNGRKSEYQLPLEYYGKKPHRDKVNAKAVEEKFSKVQQIFLEIFSDRFVTSLDKAWNFLYMDKKHLMGLAFDEQRKTRRNEDIFAEFVEFFPVETMQIEDEMFHALPPNKAIRRTKVISWLVFIGGKLLLIWMESYEILSSMQRTLVSLIYDAFILAGIIMIGIYTYEIIRTFNARKRAREREKIEPPWLKGMASWYIRRENTLFLKFANIFFWAWLIYKSLKILLLPFFK